jgi:prepilin-type processing-associated H-X9-DG protein
MRAFADKLDNHVPDCITFSNRTQDAEVFVPSLNTKVTLWRLREGIERFMITDINNPATGGTAQTTLAVMWDTVNTNNGQPVQGWLNHLPMAANVLFMDGHVEFAHYPQPAGSPFYMLTEAATKDDQPDFP